MLPVFSFAQNNEWSQEEIIKKLTEFRSEILTKNKYALTQLKLLTDRLNVENIDIKGEAFYELVTLSYIAKSLFNFSNEKILYAIDKYKFQNKINYKFNENDIETIVSNFELLQLIHIDVLRSKFPFSLEKNSDLFAEYSFYNFQQNEKVGEVGAGDGTFSLVTGLLFNKLYLFVNDISPTFEENLKNYYKGFDTFLDLDKIKIVQGNKKSTNFEVNSLDKIIIRNSFHHFKKKEKMLQSIKISLKEHGELYLYEPFDGLTDHDEKCKKIMELNECLEVIQKNGFKLEESKQLDTRMFLRFSVVK